MPGLGTSLSAFLNSRRLQDTINARRGGGAFGSSQAGGSGFTNNTFVGSDPIQNLEAFGANELREAETGAFGSLERGIIDIANQRGLEEDVAQERGLAGRVADVAAGGFNRRTATLDLSDRQRRAAGRRLSLNRAVAEAAAGSGVRRRSADAARFATQAASGLEDVELAQQLQTFTGLANAEGQKRIREAQEKANKKSNRNSLFGTIVGGIGVLASLSSETAKDKVEEGPELLSRLKKVRVDKWRYHGDESEHVGPYAEEFNEVFKTDGAAGDKRFLNLIDVVGVALGSIKELDTKVEAIANG